MERWTTEVLRHKGFRDPMIQASRNDAGEAFFGAAAGTAANGGAYLIIVMIALAGTENEKDPLDDLKNDKITKKREK